MTIIKIKTINLCYGENGNSKITLPGDDISLLDISNISLQNRYEEKYQFTPDIGNHKVKEFHEWLLCKKFVLKLDKNKVEESIMNKILHTKDITEVILLFNDNTQKRYSVPVFWDLHFNGVYEENRGNRYQRIKDNETTVEIIIG